MATSNHSSYPRAFGTERDAEQFFRETYGDVDQRIRSDLVEQIGGNLPEHVRYLEEYGITKISNLLQASQIGEIQADVASWRASKGWREGRQVGFDGTAREAYLPTSKALSEAVTHPAILIAIAAAFGQHPRLAAVSTYSVDPVGTDYREVFPFQWHHDGTSEYGYRAMVLLSDVPEGGQAMHFCPGTNKQQWSADTARETQFNNTFAEAFEQYVCSGKAGDVFIFNPHALHRGTRNNTVRRDVTAVYFQPGIARNYRLPGLHPDVVATLSPYQKRVYRAGEEEAVTIHEATFVNDLAAQRQAMDLLASEWVAPVEKIRIALSSEVDERIPVLGERNRTIIAPAIPPHIENITNADVAELKDRIEAYAPHYRAFLASPEASAYIKQLRLSIQDELQSDMNGDLDLPVRMYNPGLDQLRDDAIIQVRGREAVPNIRQVTEALDTIMPGYLAQADPSTYVQAIDTLLDVRDQLFNDLASHPEADELIQNIDALMCLAKDIQEMLSRAHSIELVRRTLLFSYLTSASVQALHGNAIGYRVSRLSQLLSNQKNNALCEYASMVVLDKLTQNQT